MQRTSVSVCARVFAPSYLSRQLWTEQQEPSSCAAAHPDQAGEISNNMVISLKTEIP